MPFNIGAPELIIILIIALIVLGPGKLPDVAQSLGKSVREFRSATHDEEKQPGAAAAAAGTPAPATTVTAVTTTAPVAGSTASAAENKCPSCATVNPVGQVFCGQCGTRLTRAA